MARADLATVQSAPFPLASASSIAHGTAIGLGPEPRAKPHASDDSETGGEVPSSAWRVRADAWEFLGYAVKQLAAASARPAAGARLAQGPRDLPREVRRLLPLLESLEMYWAAPGPQYVTELRRSLEAGEYSEALGLIEPVARRVAGHNQHAPEPSTDTEREADRIEEPAESRKRFEVLVIDDVSNVDREALQAELLNQRRPADVFNYELVFVPSFEDAIVAVLLNPDIQACVLRPGFVLNSRQRLGRDMRGFLDGFLGRSLPERPLDRILSLAEKLGQLRPELDLYLVAGVGIEGLAGSLSRRFRRIFRRQDGLELHLSLLAGVAERYEAPFFHAVQQYSRKPAGVFHALPVSRGGSVIHSKWINDLGEFYGLNLLLAETSATSGGLDSLLDPHGSLKQAQKLAARAFGAQKSLFVTNGTSTANKIVHQSILAPGDVVLVDRNCHKSHHYALMLAGAQVSYLDAYPLNDFSFYGAVPLESIKRMLLDYRRAGRLHEVKMLALTNCTFDGIVYDVERVMEECLAIKPDLVFLWDEAWFAFAGFHHIYRRRTAMASARSLEKSFADPAYARRYAQQLRELGAAGGQDGEADGLDSVCDELLLKTRLLPDPSKARLRVYSTQSTHKTLTSLRQGSMIHIHDQDFGQLNEESFREAYMTHTSTSPNYQILASLDMGRRQVEFEGYELVQRQADLAVSIAQAVARHPLLKKYFRVLGTRDLIPAQYRETSRQMPLRDGLAAMSEAWERDEFVVDPSRLTLHIGLTGVDGDTFKHDYLMDKYGIQVNKTSRNSVLFMTNIGTSRSAVAYLVEVLVKLAETFEDEQSGLSGLGQRARNARVAALTSTPPPLPDFSRFAERFRKDAETPDGNMRAAYFESYKAGSCEYFNAAELARKVAADEEMVSASFVTPYPPGFPVLVPGQVITEEILAFMSALDTREIHGFNAELGFRVLTGKPS
ncbi:aminotransferase class I/II-fold pyridoxal phosphate-dependent enzyme [Arthrobacter sp. MMS18-M83]|uniref:aminotransferase class I/II-fold pyridoxal phosphate-dependent enzyme n=1 Tax=Arthrobacter sp. MMS18-M83 TaxID=2996261 RepID=UPI00227D3C83|nr:aminotransferase class I/II-fold pyridoxal phosphate-dependent enzyme [Arthrobacter sp. MMS18-M83]WAH98590.1 aminotransferase class I/II-fold pyridoxal phosphate-dependent enzyme [Arthrobacter sp. MMS18-M83]